MKLTIEHTSDTEIIIRYGPIEISATVNDDGIDVGAYEHSGNGHYGTVWVPMENIVAEEGATS